MSTTRIAAIAGGVFIALILSISALALAQTRARIQALVAERSFANTRHGVIEYASWGAGPPVLVVHGAGGGFDQGQLLARAIGGEGLRWIAVSRFGYLGSEMPLDGSTAAQAESLIDLLDALGVKRVNILAMSGGVPPSLKLAEMNPDRIDRMMLLSSAPFTPFSPDVGDRPIPTWAYKALLGNDVLYWALTKTARGRLEEAFDARADLRSAMSIDERRFVRDLVDTFLPASRRIAGLDNEGAAVDPAAVYDLESITAEVIVVHARDDRLNPFDIGETIAARIPNSRFIGFDRGGHLLLGHHANLKEEFQRLTLPQ